jgi:hypothetical protein
MRAALPFCGDSQKYPLWYREIWGNKDETKNLRNLDINQIKDKCRLIVV